MEDHLQSKHNALSSNTSTAKKKQGKQGQTPREVDVKVFREILYKLEGLE
jgi:hypothetical protein